MAQVSSIATGEAATRRIVRVGDTLRASNAGTRETITRLHPGDTFPSPTLTAADGQPLELPGALAGHFGVVLLHRGGWCPYGVAPLRAFRRRISEAGCVRPGR